MHSILFDLFDNPTHSKIDVWFCSISELNWTTGVGTIGVQLVSIEFWLDFVLSDMLGSDCQWKTEGGSKQFPALSKTYM